MFIALNERKFGGALLRVNVAQVATYREVFTGADITLTNGVEYEVKQSPEEIDALIDGAEFELAAVPGAPDAESIIELITSLRDRFLGRYADTQAVRMINARMAELFTNWQGSAEGREPDATVREEVMPT